MRTLRESPQLMRGPLGRYFGIPHESTEFEVNYCSLT
jgi:hypothetical protein